MIDFSCKKDIFLEDEDGLIVPMSEPYFRSKLIAPDTWQVLSDGRLFVSAGGRRRGAAD